MSVDQRMRDGLAAELGRIDPDVESMLAEVESGARRQRTRRTAVLVAAAAVVAVAGVVWGAGSLDSVTGQGDVQPVDQPGELPVDSDAGWLRVEDPNLQDNHGLHMVMEIDGRLIAFGRGAVPILTSTNGIDWAPVDTPPAQVDGVIRGGPGLIAYGGTGLSFEFYEKGHQAVLWTSPDGLAWTPADGLDDAFVTPNSGISAITAGGPGFVAVGGLDAKPAVWTSTDGLEWTLGDQLTSSYGYLVDVREGGLGLVADGLEDLDPPSEINPAEYDLVAWTSADGVSWTRTTPDAVDAVGWDAELDSMVVDTIAAGPGFVAIGNDGDGTERAVVWTSADEETWTRVPEEEHGLDGWVNRVISVDGEFVAVGNVGRGEAAADVAVWTSVDGTTWERVTDESFDGPLGRSMSDVIDTDTGLVAVGTTGYDEIAVENWSAAVWVLQQP